MSDSASGRYAVIAAVLFLLLIGLAAWWATRPEPKPLAPELALRPVTFDVLAGWREDALQDAVPAFLHTCRRFAKWSEDRMIGPRGLGGRAQDWRPACAAAAKIAGDDTAGARNFFESHFTPFVVSWGGESEGLFTGYYEPLLRGSRRQSARYRVPLHARPDDLVTADLGRFDPKLKGRRFIGRVRKNRFEPYPDRAGIEAGAIADDLTIVWVDDAIDAFFLHIQGSGRVQLENGEEIRVGYAGQNGRRYYAIGRELIKRGALTRSNVSMQGIRRWLEENPDAATSVMQLNPSYIFFRELKGEGPLGALGVPLTPQRSIAVDRRHLPLGAPIWLDATRPDADAGAPDKPFSRLLMAQDTGGAIRGAVRGDVFWGHGAAAAEIAGRMKHPGRWYLLLPNSVASRRQNP